MTGQDGTAESRYVPVAEAAALLGVKPDSIRKRIRRRQLQAIKPPGSSEWLVLLDGTGATEPGHDTGQDAGQDTVALATLADASPVLGEWDALRGYHDAVVAGLVRVIERQQEQQAAILAEVLALRADVASLRDMAGQHRDATRDGTARAWWSRWRQP